MGATGAGPALHATSTADVTAVVLSMGEASTAAALASLERQTVPPAAVTVVRGVTPFHRALNQGVAAVTTPFFIQVDADMILDASCIEELRARIVAEPSAGAAMGFLRDPLIGRVSSIKLFRRSCFDRAGFPDTITPDTDFLAAMREGGWRDVYALRFAGPPDHWHTYGEHQPDYAPAYTYAKYLLEGRRYRYRGDPDGIRWHLGVLAKSRHPSAMLARIALANGIFAEGTEDRLRPFDAVEEVEPLQAFLRGTAPGRRGPSRASLFLTFDPLRLFRRCYGIGFSLRSAGAGRAFARCIDNLAARSDPLAWIAQVGLCRGLLAADTTSATVERDLERLQPLLPAASRIRLLEEKLREAASRRFPS